MQRAGEPLFYEISLIMDMARTVLCCDTILFMGVKNMY